MQSNITFLQGGPNYVHQPWDFSGHITRGDANDMRFRHGAIYYEMGGRRR